MVELGGMVFEAPVGGSWNDTFSFHPVRPSKLAVVPPRTGIFGSGQAVMSGGSGVHFGASEPRHDGADGERGQRNRHAGGGDGAMYEGPKQTG